MIQSQRIHFMCISVVPLQTPVYIRYHQAAGVYEVIDQAGGLLEEAGADCINQAEYVTDGQMIKILTREEMAQDLSNEAVADTSIEDEKVNINTADLALLMTLPGIGESKAGSIISYREEHGKFSSIEELMNITGIKEGVYTKIK